MDRTILERIGDGDASAVGECMDQYGDLVWSLARRFLHNHADAEDAVQEIFVAIWSSAARYKRDTASEVTFIATIARRRLIDRLRKADRRPKTDSMDDNPSLAPAEKKDLLYEDAEVEQVARVLDDMDPEHREIITLSVYEGYSHSEIAERLQMPLGTVKTRVRRGLIHIREQLEVHKEDSGEQAG